MHDNGRCKISRFCEVQNVILFYIDLFFISNRSLTTISFSLFSTSLILCIYFSWWIFAFLLILNLVFHCCLFLGCFSPAMASGFWRSNSRSSYYYYYFIWMLQYPNYLVSDVFFFHNNFFLLFFKLKINMILQFGFFNPLQELQEHSMQFRDVKFG